MTRRKSSAAEAPQMKPAVEPDQATVDAEEAPSMDPQQVQALEQQLVTDVHAPTMTPPSEPEAVVVSAGVSAWYTNKTITALFSTGYNNNSWIMVPGLGWRKLASSPDSACVSMNMLAALAEQTGATVNLRVESDNMVHEIYVW